MAYKYPISLLVFLIAFSIETQKGLTLAAGKDRTSVSKLIPITVGPYGSSSGHTFAFNKEGDFILTKVTVQYGAVIDSLTFEYKSNGETKSSSRYGGAGGTYDETLSLDTIGDIVQIKGSYGKYNDYVAITALSFVTKNTTYGPYGNPKATSTKFKIHAKGGKIVGFHGKFGDVLTAIGAYMVSEQT